MPMPMPTVQMPIPNISAYAYMPNARHNRRMNETWKDVIGYEGLYQVSDLGRVRSLKYGKVRILKPRNNGRSYLKVALYRNEQMRNVYVHRLVAETFIPNPLSLPEVNHKDENKANNSADNLEWCTAEYNINFGTAVARRSAKLKGKFVNGPLAKAVLQYDKSGNLVREWSSASEVERRTGFAQSNISACCLGKLKSAYEYVWKYK